jgi:alkylhydroperoxidase family enzyme
VEIAPQRGPRVAPKSPLFTEAERVALEHADATTETVNNLHDVVFARLREHYDDGQIEELTMLIARENANSRFNRVFRVPSAVLWRPA